VAIAGVQAPLTSALWWSRDPRRFDSDQEQCSVRVLLADDERLLADTVADGLRKLAMAVDVCYDGEAAMERLGVNRYDVAVLDRSVSPPRRASARPVSVAMRVGGQVRQCSVQVVNEEFMVFCGTERVEAPRR
jgi:hypothetical protein